ncbi:MAG: hypothetical protein WC603_03895 [Candidatus Paceibacterota bacterium]|jgi:beta-1,4-mannosyl-glycoprotein beta-1,4-N-acetylglucosaminyltransferase
MIYDVFLFHGELDTLDLRLNILGEKVDKFVICEARQSFSEEPCPSYYQENKERFKKWESKIINYQFNLMEDKEIVELARNSPNTSTGSNFWMKVFYKIMKKIGRPYTSHGNPYWMKVFYAMEMMKKPLEVCNEDDIVFISDCDEIWNPDIEIPKDDKVYGLEQLVYYYQLNNRSSEPWTGSIVTSYKRLKGEILNHIKQKGEKKIKNGGWHFTYQGGEEEIKRKINSSRSTYKDKTDSYYGIPTDSLMNKIKGGKDFFGRNYKFWIDESEWPKYLKENREHYLHLLK